MERKIQLMAAFFGLTAIILGAFGAHALKTLLNENQLISFETGVRYQFYHALFLLYLGTTDWITENTKKIIFYLVVSGVLFFSCSIYLLATNDLFFTDLKFMAPITPIGGLLLILAWVVFLLSIFKQKR
jgi:uncharacterized membrane protein YgdD (TMEM256/DUF423 family)